MVVVVKMLQCIYMYYAVVLVLVVEVFYTYFYMAGLGLSDQKIAARRDHAHRNRLQNLY